MANGVTPNPLNNGGGGLVRSVQRLSNKFQLGGFVVLVCAILIVQVVSPGNIPAIICAGAMGVSIIIFGQIIANIESFPRKSRAPLVIILFVLFIGLEIFLAIILASIVSSSVSISRTADFTRLACDGGEKKDVVYIDDVYKPSNKSEFYSASAEAAKDNQVEIYDMSSGRMMQLDPVSYDREHGRASYYKWNVPIVNGSARVRYKWLDSHQGEREGLAFTSSYIIRDIDAKVILPKGVALKNVEFSPVAAREKCFRVSGTGFKCEALMTNDEVRIYWDWDVWKNC